MSKIKLAWTLYLVLGESPLLEADQLFALHWFIFLKKTECSQLGVR